MGIAELGPRAAPRPQADIQYIKGGFSLGDTAVPFFSASVPVRELTSLLRLPSQIPFDPGRPIELEELFQRDLDEERVRDEIVPYLTSAGALRFFNALTVVLLPLNPADPRKLAREYTTEQGHAPQASRTDLLSHEIGSVLVSHPEGDESVGFLTWNTDLTVPVVLDGQHRFWAMQSIVNQPTGLLRDQLSSSTVSVLFLVLDERVGFSAGEEINVLAACREIFIALNKHAEKVPTSRLYLLDDRDLTAVAMRSILAETVEIDAGGVSARVRDSGRLPLGIVDWRGESAKFDSGPFITSVMALHDIVEYIADVPRPRPDQYDDARHALERIEARFGPQDDLNGASVRREIAGAEADERPFQFTRSLISVAGKAFRERFGERITEPLTRLLPYATLIEAMERAAVLGGDLEPWLSFNQAERTLLIAELGVDDPAQSVADAWTDVKREQFPLAFQVVFQKAFVYSLHSMLEWPAAVLGHWEVEGEGEKGLIDAWIERFNRVLAPALRTQGAASAFHGAGILLDGTIDFRRTRIRQITGFVSYVLLAPVDEWVAAAEDGQAPTDDIERWLRDSWGVIRTGAHTNRISGLLSYHGSRWRAGVTDLVKARAEEDAIDLEEEEVEDRHVGHGVDQLSRVVLAAADQ